MPITYIKRITGSTNNLVYLETSDTTAVATASDYIATQEPTIHSLNDGHFTWETNDCIMLSASDGISWCSITSDFATLIAFAGFGASGDSLSDLGFEAKTYTNAGGSATTTINDSAITANDIAIARWVSSANAVTIETVKPGAGTLTIVSSGDPGASVLEYFSFLESSKLEEIGVFGNVGGFSGGAETFTITDPNINSNMIVNANFTNQVNASKIYTVTPGPGTLTFVCSADPGVCLIAYLAIIPSPTLFANGLYANTYPDAGGSATISITDADITSASIVTADFSSQLNAASIEKVTPGSGTLTILASANPGLSVVDYIATSGAVGGTYLIATNNLSDVESATASATNLGLGTANNVQFANVSAGASGEAGALSSYPATASKGHLAVVGVANTGNTVTTISNAAMGQASVISIPDPAAATADFVVAPAALVSGNLVQASGTAGLVADSGIASSGLQILSASVSLSQAQVQAMYTTPVQIVAAVAGKVIVPVQATFYTNFQTSAFSSGGVGILQYGNTTHGAGTDALSGTLPTAEITAASSQVYSLGSAVGGVLTGVTNAGLFMSNQTQVFAGGSASSTLVVTVSYYLVTATT